MRKFVFTSSLALCGQLACWSQDTHYWTQQAGVRGMMVGGTLASGSYDNSAVYYNPAALAYVPTSHMAVNVDAYKFESMLFKNGAGDGNDLTSQRLTLYPQMASSMLTHRPERRLQVGFAMVTRQSAYWDINTNVRQEYDILPNHAGTEDYLGSITYQNILNETWIGLGAGYRINRYMSVGWSSFVSYRNQRYETSIDARAAYYDNTAFISSYSYSDELRLNNLKNINKLGFHANYNGWRLGLVATLPSINIAGWSKSKRQIEFQNIDGNINGVLFDQQKNLPTNYKYPFSIALGIAHQFPRSWVGISAEYFHNIEPYKMVEGVARNVFYPSTLVTTNNIRDLVSFYNFANAVCNFGIGAEWDMNKVLVLHTGLRTDISYYRYQPNNNRRPPHVPNPNSNNVVLLSPNFDLYHASIGLSWRRRASLLSMGFNYSLGYRDRVQQMVNFNNPQYNALLQGARTSDASIISHAFTGLLGYTYYFALQ